VLLDISNPRRRGQLIVRFQGSASSTSSTARRLGVPAGSGVQLASGPPVALAVDDRGRVRIERLTLALPSAPPCTTLACSQAGALDVSIDTAAASRHNPSAAITRRPREEVRNRVERKL